MTMTRPWWTLVYYRPDWTDGETHYEWSEQSARNVLLMAHAADQSVRLEHWTPSCRVLSDDRPGAVVRVLPGGVADPWQEIRRLRLLIEERFGARPCCGVPFNAPRCGHGERAAAP
jgi:hypothetical protein